MGAKDITLYNPRSVIMDLSSKNLLSLGFVNIKDELLNESVRLGPKDSSSQTLTTDSQSHTQDTSYILIIPSHHRDAEGGVFIRGGIGT